MSGKAKMRCARCHKPFRASTPKQTLCAECEAKERRARATAKTTTVASTAVAPTVKPKIVGPGANILVPGLVPPPPPAASRRPEHAAPDRDRDHDRSPDHGQPLGRPGQASLHPYPHPSPQQPVHSGPAGGRGMQGRPQPQQRSGQQRLSTPPRPKKEQAPVIMLTPELRERIEARYRELAQPVEFDGIRTRIAADLALPKALVKKAVLELRLRDQMPSWWELQGFHGTDEELGRIRAAYAPHLPLPPVGVHKQIAADLGLDPGGVYQAIRRIRAEMHLPQYNPPEAHTPETQEMATSGQSAAAAEVPAHAATTSAPGADSPGATAG